MDEALDVCRQHQHHQHSSFHPLNAVTALTLVDGLAKCRDPAPRIVVDEPALELVEDLLNHARSHNHDRLDTVKVHTALVRAYGMATQACTTTKQRRRSLSSTTT